MKKVLLSKLGMLFVLISCAYGVQKPTEGQNDERLLYFPITNLKSIVSKESVHGGRHGGREVWVYSYPHLENARFKVSLTSKEAGDIETIYYANNQPINIPQWQRKTLRLGLYYIGVPETIQPNDPFKDAYGKNVPYRYLADKGLLRDSAGNPYIGLQPRVDPQDPLSTARIDLPESRPGETIYGTDIARASPLHNIPVYVKATWPERQLDNFYVYDFLGGKEGVLSYINVGIPSLLEKNIAISSRDGKTQPNAYHLVGTIKTLNQTLVPIDYRYDITHGFPDYIRVFVAVPNNVTPQGIYLTLLRPDQIKNRSGFELHPYFERPVNFKEATK